MGALFTLLAQMSQSPPFLRHRNRLKRLRGAGLADASWGQPSEMLKVKFDTQ